MKFIKKLRDYGISIILALLIYAILYGISWIATCGIIKLITVCFGWTFRWSYATGIWIILCLVQPMFFNDHKIEED